MNALEFSQGPLNSTGPNVGTCWFWFLHCDSFSCCVWWQRLWLWKLERETGAGWYKNWPWKHEGLSHPREEKKTTKKPTKTLQLYGICWYPQRGKKTELRLRGSGRSITSGLSRKKEAGLCFEGLWTCLVDNNSPVDACLAGTLLTLPPTFSAPPHLIYLHLLLALHLLLPPTSFLYSLFTVSLSDHSPAAGVTYISYSTVYIISNTCGRKKGNLLFPFLKSFWRLCSHLFG